MGVRVPENTIVRFLSPVELYIMHKYYTADRHLLNMADGVCRSICIGFRGLEPFSSIAYKEVIRQSVII